MRASWLKKLAVWAREKWKDDKTKGPRRTKKSVGINRTHLNIFLQKFLSSIYGQFTIICVHKKYQFNLFNSCSGQLSTSHQPSIISNQQHLWITVPLSNLSMAICCWIVLGLWFIIYKKMTRLQFLRDANEFCCCKGTTFIWVVQEFGDKSDDLKGVFNSCWVFGRAKCGIYKSMWVDYKLYWGMWEDSLLLSYYYHQYSLFHS